MGLFDLFKKSSPEQRNREVFEKDALKFVQNHSLQEFSKRVEEIYNKILNQ